MGRINKTYLTGGIFIALAIWIIFQTGAISEKLVSNEPGPKLFPYIAAIGIIVCSVLTMIFDGREEKNRKQGAVWSKDIWKRLGTIFLELFIFAIAMYGIGFLLAGIIMMPVLIWTLRGDKKINAPLALIFSVGLTLIAYLGFTRGLQIPLPRGAVWESLGITLPL